MKRLFLFALIAVALPSAMADGLPPDNTGSLWSDSKPNPFLDRTARKEGDILTIIISETSTATFSASTTTSKTDNNTVGKTIVPILSTLVPNLIPNTSGSSSGSLSSAGSGATSSTGKFTARMSAVVKKVLPNGNLVIEGTRYVKVNKDTQTFVLSGVIKPDSVRPDNTVLSEHIAEAEIRAEGKGAISERQRKGILSRLLDWLF